jgi:hypothetical protein
MIAPALAGVEAEEDAKNLVCLDALLAESPIIQHARALPEIGVWQKCLHAVRNYQKRRKLLHAREGRSAATLSTRACMKLQTKSFGLEQFLILMFSR